MKFIGDINVESYRTSNFFNYAVVKINSAKEAQHDGFIHAIAIDTDNVRIVDEHSVYCYAKLLSYKDVSSANSKLFFKKSAVEGVKVPARCI